MHLCKEGTCFAVLIIGSVVDSVVFVNPKKTLTEKDKPTYGIDTNTQNHKYTCKYTNTNTTSIKVADMPIM